MTSSKYFAYYIPINKPCIMNNIVNSLIKEYGENNYMNIKEQVLTNININDWEETINDYCYSNLKSLVLVKFTDVSELFITDDYKDDDDNLTINLDVKPDMTNLDILELHNLEYYKDITNNYVYEIIKDTEEIGKCIGIYNATNNTIKLHTCKVKPQTVIYNQGTTKMQEIYDDKYLLINQNQEMFRQKLTNGDYSPYRARKNTFSGTQNNTYTLHKQKTSSILAEIILIPLASIFIQYDSITFDCIATKQNNFTNTLQNAINAGKMDDIRAQLIYKIMNDIIKKQDPANGNSYHNIKKFLPLIPDDNQSNLELVKNLWNELMSKYNDPLAFLQNQKLIIDNTFILEKYYEQPTEGATHLTPNQALASPLSEGATHLTPRPNGLTEGATHLTPKQALASPLSEGATLLTPRPNGSTEQQNINQRIPLYKEICKLNAKLYITEKKFEDITYKDALPYQTFFNCNENIFTNTKDKHNYVSGQLETLENRLESTMKLLRSNKTTEANKISFTNQIENIKDEILELQRQLTTIDPYYKEHILHKTNIGIRLMFSDQINASRSLIYLRMICMNIDKLKGKFLYKYEYNSSRFIDIFKFYIDKALLKDIVSLKIKTDLFSISRLFKITMDDKYKDDKTNISDELFTNCNNTNSDIETLNLPSVHKLNTFLANNLAMNLIYHQKNNLLWMLKLEDQIDERTLVVPGFIGKINIDYTSLNDIKAYIYRLKSNTPESYLKNYAITFDGQKYYIDISNDATIARVASVISLLNADNVRYNNTNNLGHYNYDSNVIENIITDEEYFKKHQQNIELCGGALCDEVGLGKTLSIISYLIMKMKNDMLKYSRFKARMADLLPELDERPDMAFTDPIDNGFEYNNLIIVPSRLTSQWESEIEKYCKDKFKLRVKVLVSISSIKTLEKELHEFYYNRKHNIPTNTDDNTSTDGKKKSKSSKSKKQSTSTPDTKQNNVSQKPIINTNIEIKEPEVKINECDNISSEATEATESKKTTVKISKKTREQIMIEKLMEKAKKANAKLAGSKKINTNSSNINIEQEKVKDKPYTGITFDSILNNNISVENNGSHNNIVKPVVDVAEVAEVADVAEVAETKVEKEPTVKLHNPDTEDIYSYINHYLDCDETGSDYYEDQLYDVYIISVNLLSNENYLDYITHNIENHLRPFVDGIASYDYHWANVKKIQEYYNGDVRKICRMTDKFNIFKIKWNRIILDEAHEKLNPVIKLFSTSIKNYLNGHHKYNHEDQYLFENLVILKSNYRWAITGTPAQSGLDNIMGILQFLTKKNVFEDHIRVVEKVRYFSNLIGIARADMNTILNKIFKKTFKKDVRKLLNIPLFTEEIIYVDQTNIERNIYNTIRCSRHFTEAVKLRRLFLMCTNILINEGYDLDSNNEITTTEILTLEKLNANMIAKFSEQLKQIGLNETRLLQANELFTTRISEWAKVLDHIMSLNLEGILQEQVLTEINGHFGNLDKPGNRANAEIIYNLLDMFTAYNEPDTAGMIVFNNLITVKNHFYRIWRATWDNENVCSKIAYSGAKVGKIKMNEEIQRNNKKLEMIATDKKRINNQIALFSNNEFLKEKTADPCIICFEDLHDVVVTPCRHVFCLNCTKHLSQNLVNNFSCPECRTLTMCKNLNITTVDIIKGAKKPEPEKTITEVNNNTFVLNGLEKKLGKEWRMKCINKYGSKMAMLVEYLYKLFENAQNRVIIFSQYDKMLKMIGKTLDEYGIKFVYCQGNNYVVNKNINKFKKDDSIRVIMLSSETSNSGSNLTEANYIILIDVLYQDQQHVKATEQQIVGRAVRLGQKLPVKVVRFITKGTIEEEHFVKNRYDMNTLQE